MRDFFNTNLESDSYNLEGGVSVSSGPNAVIFGLGGSGGVISTSYKKATASRDALTLEFRTDSAGSFRVMADANKVLIKDKLAFRFVALDDHFETYRDGSKGNQERYFFALTARPWKGGTFNAYYEDVGIRKGLPRNYVAYDGGVTAYLARLANGGTPYYDNSGSTAIQPGWADLVERAYRLLEQQPDPVLAQVKEKFGGLRFYHYPDVPEIADIEEESLHVCEVCGAKGEARHGGWIKTLCDEHVEAP